MPRGVRQPAPEGTPAGGRAGRGEAVPARGGRPPSDLPRCERTRTPRAWRDFARIAEAAKARNDPVGYLAEPYCCRKVGAASRAALGFVFVVRSDPLQRVGPRSGPAFGRTCHSLRRKTRRSWVTTNRTVNSEQRTRPFFTLATKLPQSSLSSGNLPKRPSQRELTLRSPGCSSGRCCAAAAPCRSRSGRTFGCVRSAQGRASARVHGAAVWNLRRDRLLTAAKQLEAVAKDDPKLTDAAEGTRAALPRPTRARSRRRSSLRQVHSKKTPTIHGHQPRLLGALVVRCGRTQRSRQGGEPRRAEQGARGPGRRIAACRIARKRPRGG